jgi:histidinol-phosphate aminotransferase
MGRIDKHAPAGYTCREAADEEPALPSHCSRALCPAQGKRVIHTHIRPDILAMPEVAYGLVDPDEVAERQGMPAERIIKLDANENVYGPSPKVFAALAETRSWHIYPDLTHQALNRALAAYAGVDEQQIVATNGCDELILLLAQILITPGDEAIDNLPTFSVYDWVLRIQDGKVVVVPRRREDDYALDTAGVLSAVTERTRLIFICNPNNPTGGLTPQQDIVSILETGVVVAVDETYHEFSGVTMLPLMARYPNLIILRSLSKWAALASLRVGYGICHPDVARQMHKIRMPFNVNKAGYIAALASLADKDYLMANVAKIITEREHLLNGLRRISFLHCYPSQGNFILCDVAGVPARVLRDEVEREGVLVRAYQSSHLPNAVRVSVGKPEHTEAAIAALRSAGRRLNLQ